MLRIWSKSKKQEIDRILGKYLKQGVSYTIQPFQQGQIPDINPGDILFALGSQPLELLQEAGIVPKGRKTGSLRSKIHPYQQGGLMISYSPGISEIHYPSYVDLTIDVRLAMRQCNTGSIEPKVGSYRWVDDFTELIAKVKERIKSSKGRVSVCTDLETVGLVSFNPSAHIVSISFSYREGKSDLVYFEGLDDQPNKGDKLYEQINWLMNCQDISMCGANLKYDLVWERVKWGMSCSNFKFDSTIVGSLLNENRLNGLNTHAKIATDMGGYDDYFNNTHDKSRMDLVPKDDLLTYAGGDTDAGLRVRNVFAKELLKDRALVNLYTRLIHPAGRAFEDMEIEGIVLDVPYYMKLQKELEKELARLEKIAFKQMPRRITGKYADNLKLTRPAIIKEFMFTKKGLNLTPQMWTDKTKKLPMKDRIPSTNKKHMKLFTHVPEAKAFMDEYNAYNSASKTLSTYVVGFMKHLRPDNRLHPTAVLYKGDVGGDEGESGTVTGRLSFKNPACQTIPKHTKWADKLRRGYTAPPGYKIVNWDYSQGELRVIACVANSKPMIEAYAAGFDLHLKTGAMLNGYEFEDALAMMQSKDEGDKKIMKVIRQGGKAGNFGLIYGMSAKGYKEFAYDTYGVVMTEMEAEQQRNGFFELYPELIDYHREYITHAKLQGFVRSPLGRIRHLPLINSRDGLTRSSAERQAINSPIQSALSDLSCWSLSRFKEQYGTPDSCRFWGMTHDSLTAYVKEDMIDVWVPRMKDIMENLPLEEVFNWTPQLKFITDAEVGDNYADLVDYAEYMEAA